MASQKMPALNKLEQRYIVDLFACYATLDEVVKAVLEVFGKDYRQKRSTLLRYDASSAQGSTDLAKDLQAYFWERREKFLKDEKRSPISVRQVRFRRLEELFQRHKEKSPQVVLDIIKMAEEIEGGVFTNKRELTGRNGAPLAVALAQMTNEQLLRLIQDGPGGGGPPRPEDAGGGD